MYKSEVFEEKLKKQCTSMVESGILWRKFVSLGVSRSSILEENRVKEVQFSRNFTKSIIDEKKNLLKKDDFYEKVSLGSNLV